MGRGMPSMGPNRYPGDTYGGASGMPPYAQQVNVCILISNLTMFANDEH